MFQISHPFPLPRSLLRIRPSSRPCVTFRNKLELLAPRPTSKLEDHPFSAVGEYLFNIFATILHIWRPVPPSTTRGRAVLWWEELIKFICLFVYLFIYFSMISYVSGHRVDGRGCIPPPPSSERFVPTGTLLKYYRELPSQVKGGRSFELYIHVPLYNNEVTNSLAFC
jgi:hypothetical protein